MPSDALSLCVEEEPRTLATTLRSQLTRKGGRRGAAPWAALGSSCTLAAVPASGLLDCEGWPVFWLASWQAPRRRKHPDPLPWRSCWILAQRSSTSTDQANAGGPAPRGPFRFHVWQACAKAMRVLNGAFKFSQGPPSRETGGRNIWFFCVAKPFPAEPTLETHFYKEREKKSLDGKQYHLLIGRHHTDTQSLILPRPKARQFHKHTASLQNCKDR